MPSQLDDDRIQFFLRHRDDIRAWAAIESEVTAAVRELLGSTQPMIEEGIRAIDSDCITTRNDGGRWQRIVAQRASWPRGAGLSLEWETGVDPFGRVLPKIGVIFLGQATPQIQEAFLTLCRDRSELVAEGYRIPAEAVWPVMRRVPKSRDWWADPESWTSGIVRDIVRLWQQVAPLMDRATSPATLAE